MVWKVFGIGRENIDIILTIIQIEIQMLARVLNILMTHHRSHCKPLDIMIQGQAEWKEEVKCDGISIYCLDWMNRRSSKQQKVHTVVSKAITTLF